MADSLVLGTKYRASFVSSVIPALRMPVIDHGHEVTEEVPTKQVEDRRLRFNDNGTFQISVFEDLHFAENAARDIMTKDVMTSVMSHENAQLFILNGDLISGEATHRSNASQYLHEVVSPLVDADGVWASTYGNHDSDVNLDPRKDIYEQERRYRNSLTRSMVAAPEAGITNYYLPVYPHEDSADTPVLILWFFDSKGGHYPADGGEDGGGTRGDWVDESVVEWFTETNANLTAEYGRTIPSLAFYHIPAHAMLGYQEEGVDANTSPGINGETVVPQGTGDTDYTGQDRLFMRALLNITGLMGTFSGHDHDNDWCFKWDGHFVDQSLTGNGINMCYGRHTGYGGYGNARRGARQIFLDQSSLGDGVHTWVRLEDGTISAPVALNATYGQDQYGEVFSRMAQVSGALRVYDLSLSGLMVYLWIPVLAFWCRRCL